MMPVRLSALAALLVGSVSAFAPPASLAGQRLTSWHLAASPPTLSDSPKVFFQSRIAEPEDVGSVSSAASLLSDKFPEEPFVVHYHSRDIQDVKIEKRPILDLSVLKKIVIDDSDNVVTIDAGVTIERLTTKLKNKASSDLKELFYSLPASGRLSVVEAALDTRYKKLHKAVAEVHVVDKDGNINSKQLSEVDAQEDIVVSVVLSPPHRESSELAARWYSKKNVDSPVPDTLVSNIPEDVKIIVHKHGMFNDIPNIVVFVDGGRDLGLPKDEWNEVLVETPQELWYLQNELSQVGGLGALTATGVLDTSKVNPSFDVILKLFREREENLMIWYEKGQIRASFDSEYPPDVDDNIGECFEFDEEVPRTIAYHEGEKPEFSKRYTKIKPTVIRGTVIEGFKGEIYDGLRETMQICRMQYATSSYDNMMNPSLIVYPLDAEDVSLAIKYATLPEFKEARTTHANPSGSAFKVMGRGGGHQYCGVSCDNDAFIISMDEFEKLESFEVDLKDVTGPDGTLHDVKREVHVGTGVKLKAFATFNNIDPNTGEKALGTNNNFGWTIPHGECPTVGIGGHSQSGGYGHIARAFGLAIDYVYGFTIVLADGEIRDVTRDSPNQQDRDIYWAVMGGSPGAFGVTTNLIFHPILDEDYPHSTAYTRRFCHSPERMKAIMNILEDFINRAKADDDNAIAEELDLMVSLTSNNGNRLNDQLNQEKDSITPNLDVMVFELECSDMTNPKARAQMDEIIHKFEDTVQLAWPTSLLDIGVKFQSNKYDGKSHYKLSEMSLGFTRVPPGTTEGGRENRKPYRKMCYGSKDKLTEGWAESFGSLLNDVVATEEDISCVFQVVVGGGKQASYGKANLNAIAHRDAQLHGLIFDLFRGDDDASIKGAANFSKRFELNVVNKHQTAHPKVMAQWASHGDLDMNNPRVWEKYFDNPDTYHRLRRIKKDVDPEDVFHSRFTVRPEKD